MGHSCTMCQPRRETIKLSSPPMPQWPTFLACGVGKTTLLQWHLKAGAVPAPPVQRPPYRRVGFTPPTWLQWQEYRNKLKPVPINLGALSLRAVSTEGNLHHAGLSLCHRSGHLAGRQRAGLLHGHHADRQWHLKCMHVRLQWMQRSWSDLWPQLHGVRHSLQLAVQRHVRWNHQPAVRWDCERLSTDRTFKVQTHHVT